MKPIGGGQAGGHVPGEEDMSMDMNSVGERETTYRTYNSRESIDFAARYDERKIDYGEDKNKSSSSWLIAPLLVGVVAILQLYG